MTATDLELPRRAVVGVAVAAAGLAGILVLAALLHGDVMLAYEERGSGCRELSPARAADLERALIAIQVLLAGWVIATGAALSGRVAAVQGRNVAAARWSGRFAAVPLAGALMIFVGTDILSAFLPLLAVWGLVLCAAVALTVSAVLRRDQPAARWLWVRVGWRLLTGGGLSVAMLVLTGDGAILSC